MAVALRPYLTAGLALTTVGAAAVVPPVAARLPVLPLASPAVTLTADGASLLNVPLNLFQQVVNIPYNEVQALEVMAQSLLFTGPWFRGSPTNIWGEEPGDPGHFQSLMNLFVPFPTLSGAGNEGDYSYPGLGQQLSLLAAAEIPSNTACASLDCLPMVPTSPITGVTAIDQLIWTTLVFTFIQKFPLLDNWLQVPLSELTQGDGYTFDVLVQDPATGDWEVNQTLINSGPVDSSFLWPGTRFPTDDEIAEAAAKGVTLDPNTPLMPWAGETFKLDVFAPFVNFFNSLQEPFDASKFALPDPLDFLRAVQALIGGAFLDFNPFVYGSPLCPGPCVMPDGSQTYEWFIHGLNDFWPGNTYLQDWISLYDNQQLGYATDEANDIADYLTWLWRQQSVWFNFYNGLPEPYGNPLPPDPAIDTSGFLPTMAEVNAFVADTFGPGVQVFLDNVGVLGPFDFDALWNLFFPPAM